tara:strand:- start:1933 stop:2241 length:309 start_codon:yes stop_codon:yes gene_type:complete
MIFNSIHELRSCLLEILEDYIPREDYLEIISKIDEIKNLEIDDETKQNVCNNKVMKILIKNDVVPSYKIIEWLKERREEYLDLIDYIQRDNDWKRRHNIVTE